MGGLLSCQAEVLQGLALISEGYQCFSISSLSQTIFRILYKGVLTGCNRTLWITSLQGAIRQGMPVRRQGPGSILWCGKARIQQCCPFSEGRRPLASRFKTFGELAAEFWVLWFENNRQVSSLDC